MFKRRHIFLTTRCTSTVTPSDPNTRSTPFRPGYHPSPCNLAHAAGTHDCFYSCNMCNRAEYPDRTWRCNRIARGGATPQSGTDVTSFGLCEGYLYKPTPGCMAPNLSLVCVLGALAGTSGQGTNSTTLSTSCTCTVDTASVAELAAQPVPTAPREETRFLFLLGYPHTGTSAMYFLLSTSASVTGIEGEADVHLGPSKEGMAHFENHRPRGRWEADFPQIWEAQYATQAETLYLNKTLPGKLFVENSPPEIYLPHQLNATFSKHGKVRFILLVHGMCGKDLCAFTGYCRGLEKRMNITLDKNNRGVAPWAMALHNITRLSLTLARMST